jgi:general secretion pathway protein G
MPQTRRPSTASGRRSNRGWTLLELALIVGLIGTLVAVALPLYNNHRDKVRQAQTIQDISTMSAAIEHYWQDNRDYPDSLADVDFGGRKDPWGRAYNYYNIDKNGRGAARKDKALNPINTDFDLYSVGADGKTKKQVSHRDSEDDVIRASNGRFIDLAVNF